MATVAQLLQIKGANVWKISPDVTMYDALVLMAEKDIGALLVVEGDQVIGILTERDYARKVALKGKTSQTALVKDIMTTQIIYVTPDQTVEECMAIMTNRHFRHLPVVENGKLAGIVSIGDAVKSVIEDKEFLIGELEKYIVGARF
jgi:CBS domain-containing protein